MKNRNQFYLLVIVVVLFLVSIMAFTFAYIGRPTVAGNTSVNTSISGIILTYSGNTSVALDLTYDNLSKSTATNNYSNYTSNTVVGTVTLDAPSNYSNGVTCQYRIVYRPITVYIPSAAAVSAGLRELELEFGDGTNTITTLSLDNLSSKTTLHTTSISTNTGNTTTSQSWTTTLKFYNLNVDQNSVLEQNPKGSIEIETISCGGR